MFATPTDHHPTDAKEVGAIVAPPVAAGVHLNASQPLDAATIKALVLRRWRAMVTTQGTARSQRIQ